MKKLLFILVGFLFSFPLFSQNEYQQEIICPCMLEFKFPLTFYETNMIEGAGGAYGGVPVLRFKNASIENNILLCTYEDELASTGIRASDTGFGFTIVGDIPNYITLTLITDYLNNWEVNTKFIKLKNRMKGFVLFPICFPEEDQNGRYYGWPGAFYSENYEGKAITLKRSFEGEARLNTTKNGFIISSTKTGLYTPVENTEGLSNSINKKMIEKAPSKREKKKAIRQKKRELKTQEGKELIKRKN